jgi:hypothetical protein
MSLPSNEVAKPETQALSRLSFCGPPPLLRGENGAAYDDLLARVSGQLKPSDIFEEIWTRDLVDIFWEGLRWRRYLAHFLDAMLPTVLEAILKPLVKDEPTAPARGRSFVSRINAAHAALVVEQDLVRLWASGDAAAIKRVEELLASVGLTMDHVAAKTAAGLLDKVEGFNRLIASTEWRRDALLREIERRRSAFAKNLPRKVEQIENAEFKTVEANTATKTLEAEPVETQLNDANTEANTVEANHVEAKIVEANTATKTLEAEPVEAKLDDAKTDAKTQANTVEANAVEANAEIKAVEAKPVPTEIAVAANTVAAEPDEDDTFEDETFEDETVDDDAVVVKVVQITVAEYLAALADEAAKGRAPS